MDIYKKASSEIIRIMKKKKVKQSDLLNPLGKNKSNTSNLINGIKAMNLEEAQVLSKELSIEFTVNENGVEVKDLIKKKKTKK